jgi:predicted SprT family Zn-dependent metalloprotease
VTDPTRTTYVGFTEAYDFFNDRLFGARLPRCLITMQRRANTLGYFAQDQFGTRDRQEVTDEIALNPKHFRERSTEDSLSTLVHEMCHLQQRHFGKPPRRSYHNREWADMMRAVGLVPSDTGKPGGRQTGQHMTHYIARNGSFETACAELLASGFTIRYVDLEENEETKKKKLKVKYTCPGCDANAWGKPELNLICGDCLRPFITE